MRGNLSKYFLWSQHNLKTKNRDTREKDNHRNEESEETTNQENEEQEKPLHATPRQWINIQGLQRTWEIQQQKNNLVEEMGEGNKQAFFQKDMFK